MKFEKLSIEHKQIANYLIQGFSNIEIAEEVGYSERTINNKLRELCKFYHVQNSKKLPLKIISDRLDIPIENIFLNTQ